MKSSSQLLTNILMAGKVGSDGRKKKDKKLKKVLLFCLEAPVYVDGCLAHSLRRQDRQRAEKFACLFMQH